MIKNNIQIYSLNCPFSDVVKYIGKTQNLLSVRLSAHLSYSGSNIQKIQWIKSLRDKNTKPVIKLLEIVGESNWEEKEIWWIEHFINNGVELLNAPLDANHKSIILKQYKRELIRVGYRENTIVNYCSSFLKFLYAFDGFVYNDINKNSIIDYLSSLVENDKISESYQNSLINAVKFYYEKVLHRPRQEYYIARPKKRKKIRPILTIEQTGLFMDTIKNLKQKTLFQTMYSGAMRTSEVASILISNINFEERTLKIVDAKGGKDRIISLPQQTIIQIQFYISKYNPSIFLFEGQKKGDCYSSRSIQVKFNEIINILNFDKELTPHCLRHSRTTHVLNNGVKIEMASKFIGHSSISTTADTYYHYMNDEMKNQFDLADESILKKSEQAKINRTDLKKSISYKQ